MPLLLLPERRRLRGDAAVAPLLLRALARADASQASAGEAALLHGAFDILPRGLSAAALSREHDARDAAFHRWLRVDPGHVRADMGVGRLLACGELGLTPDEAEALLRPLRPLFGDEGFPISAPHPARWYLMLPREVQLPAFADPDDVLGDDVFAHLPQGDAGRRWRRLLNEAQVILHNHPVNAARAQAGRVTVNTVWFWGGGGLPDSVRTGHGHAISADPVLLALAGLAGITAGPLQTAAEVEASAMVDLRELRDLASLEREWIAPLLARLHAGGFDALDLAFADGLRARCRARHRWRFWRRTSAQLAMPPA